jgi:hypothetical protein
MPPFNPLPLLAVLCWGVLLRTLWISAGIYLAERDK